MKSSKTKAPKAPSPSSQSPSPSHLRQALLGIIDETNRATRIARALRGASAQRLDNPECLVGLIEPIIEGQLGALSNVIAFAESLQGKR